MQITQFIKIAILSVATLSLAGCVRFDPPSKYMQVTVAGPETPPSGKSLVFIHRPKAKSNQGFYTGVWDSKHLIGDFGNGHSMAYVCKPAKHYFINRSPEVVAVIEADLLPDHTYDLWVETAGMWVPSFRLRPVTRNSKQRAKVAAWAKENHWMTRNPTATEHEQLRQNEIELILHDFVEGEKKSRLQHLSADDHR